MARKNVGRDRPSLRERLKKKEAETRRDSKRKPVAKIRKKHRRLNPSERDSLLAGKYVQSCFWGGCGDPRMRARQWLQHVRAYDPPEETDGMNLPTGVMIIFDD
jgi:hypothetical protein